MQTALHIWIFSKPRDSAIEQNSPAFEGVYSKNSHKNMKSEVRDVR